MKKKDGGGGDGGGGGGGVICLVSLFPPELVIKLPKIVHFLQICADHSEKSKSIEVVYLYQIRIHKLL